MAEVFQLLNGNLPSFSSPGFPDVANQPGFSPMTQTSQESVLSNEILTGQPLTNAVPNFNVNAANPGEVQLTQSLLAPPNNVLTNQLSPDNANTFAGAQVLTSTPGQRIAATPNFLTVGEPPANDALATGSTSRRLLSGLPSVASGRPLSSPIALPPPTLNEALYGPVAPNTLFGEATTGDFQQSSQFGPNPNQTFDTVTESTIRAICNTTSQLGAILCDAYIRNPEGGVLADIEGNNIAQGCVGSRYGCCENNLTFKLNTEGSNCSNRSDFVCASTIFGCCPGTRLKRANLIGTNCPQGAVPLVGWDVNSTEAEKRAAGFGFRDPKFFGNEQEFAATLPGTTLSDAELIRRGIIPADRFQTVSLSNTTSPSGLVTRREQDTFSTIPITPNLQQVSFRNNLGF